MKILVVTPKFPYPPAGACEQDRATGIEMFLKLGHEVYVITKIYHDDLRQNVREISQKLGITIVPVRYKYLGDSTSIREKWARLIRPWYWDGAAFEYSEPEMRVELAKALDSFKPDLVWFDYSYLWPLYHQVRKRNLPIVTRPINFEAIHFLEENGRSLFNYFRFVPKLLSEYLVGRSSDFILAITPDEVNLYKKIGARQVALLPLRGLSHCFDFKAQVAERRPLNVFFSGSTYNVAHNRLALEFFLKKIVPQARAAFPGEFRFHIFGGKAPADLASFFNDETIYHGYVPTEEWSKVLTPMDIALVPSLYGAGMQQKIFEPLCRGFPTIVSPRGLAGYPFKGDEQLLLANTPAEFVDCLGRLRQFSLRRRLAEQGRALAETLFSNQTLAKVATDTLNFFTKE